jgi:hypothetical protein
MTSVPVRKERKEERKKRGRKKNTKAKAHVP